MIIQPKAPGSDTSMIAKPAADALTSAAPTTAAPVTDAPTTAAPGTCY